MSTKAFDMLSEEKEEYVLDKKQIEITSKYFDLNIITIENNINKRINLWKWTQYKSIISDSVNIKIPLFLFSDKGINFSMILPNLPSDLLRFYTSFCPKFIINSIS